MSDESRPATPPVPDPSVTAHTITLDGTETTYRAEAGWLVLTRGEKPAAEMFHVFYETEAAATRPLTFVFNGGPGAASAYLHVGAVGPRRVVFDESGNPLPPPVQSVDNSETWLKFTDLVFIDPVGTGFSRAIVDDSDDKEEKKKEPDEALKEKSKQYWKIRRDLESLGDFITLFLSKHHRWDSPIFLAGESYGGFRGAKLARLLQETYGVGLNGVILISPALEFSLLSESDYDVLPWIDRIPSMAGAAYHHGRASGPASSKSEAEFVQSATEFAAAELATALIQGSGFDAREKTLKKLAQYVGLKPDQVIRTGGRVSAQVFTRLLLEDRGLACGRYDATITTPDPFPGRETYEGPDPTLRSIERVFAAGINAHLRRVLAVDTARRYHLLSMEVNQNWQVDLERHALDSQIGATDDLRYAMTLNPQMKVRITHGVYDLVTPYYASDRIARSLFLDESLARNLSLVHYPGGHMFYAWTKSREKFSKDIAAFYADAVSSSK